jgi:TetR/AcrR family transcriptional regulator, regulator of autoinduction and epiphytic fitness
MPTIEEEDLSTDGRRLRGQRTQTKVLEALLELVAEGEMRPTAQAVSNRAGVSLRTVYHHFEDVEDVRRRALDLQRSRYQAGFRTIDQSLPIDERIEVFCRQVRRLFEAITPIRRSMLADDPISAELREGRRRAREIRLAQLLSTFPELAERSRDAKQLLAAVDVATSWPTWNYQRESLGRSAIASEAVMATLMRALLAGSPSKRDTRKMVTRPSATRPRNTKRTTKR